MTQKAALAKIVQPRSYTYRKRRFASASVLRDFDILCFLSREDSKMHCYFKRYEISKCAMLGVSSRL